MRKRWSLSLLLGLLLAAVMVALWLIPYLIHLDPSTMHFTFWVNDRLTVPPLAPGTNGYLLGTDAAGRDLLARLIYGVRLTLGVALGIGAGRALLAIPIGLVAGWYGGRWAHLTTLFSTSLSSLPTLLLVLLVLNGLSFWRVKPEGAWLYGLVIGLAGVPRLAEQVRQLTGQVRTEPFIESAVAAGASTPRILFRHVLPVIRGDLVIAMAAELSWVLLLMGELAVFGIFLYRPIAVPREGMPTLLVEQIPEWGQMMGANRTLIRSQPWLPLYPALLLGLAIAGLQLLAEGLRQRWLHH